MLSLPSTDPLAVAVVTAIRSGNVSGLESLLKDNPGLANGRIVTACGDPAGAGERTLLHVATDWPGNFPNVAETVSTLVAHGADVNARLIGPHSETPLHWAASSDDVAALDALLDRGADIEATGAVIGGGTALADAAAFGQWRAARRLVERGALANLWQAAALGLIDRVTEFFQTDSPVGISDLNVAFWCACHGGQRISAEYLLSKGADRNWVGFDRLTPLGAASRSRATELVAWLRTQGCR